MKHNTKLNGADRAGAMDMGSKRAYAGNCRMIEIGSPGHPFRLVFNVDHIDSIRFEEAVEERTIRVPGSTGVAATFDDDGNEVTPAIPPATEQKMVSVGWTVIITANGAQSGINFPNVEAAMGCYNSIINMIQAVGVPHVFMGPLKPPEEPSGIVGPDGKAIADAFDAADLHPDLAGGPGAGVAPNDDDIDGDVGDFDPDFELSDEDLALLENPQFDDSIDQEIEAQAEPAEDPPEDPPANH
jgi:hypothetical protein